MSEDHIIKAMERIIEETYWADSFPTQCHERIRAICEAVKNDTPLPFLDNQEQT
jgi:hypothetical protein